MTTVTIKGQVTIPKKIRNMYGMIPETEIDFITGGKNVIICPHKENI